MYKAAYIIAVGAQRDYSCSNQQRFFRIDPNSHTVPPGMVSNGMGQVDSHEWKASLGKAAALAGEIQTAENQAKEDAAAEKEGRAPVVVPTEWISGTAVWSRSSTNLNRGFDSKAMKGIDVLKKHFTGSEVEKELAVTKLQEAACRLGQSGIAKGQGAEDAATVRSLHTHTLVLYCTLPQLHLVSNAK